MILKLNNFGKFKNREFEISNYITLFYGENESGKTTIFDSLMYLFSENKKSSTFYKQLKNRYANDIDVEIIPPVEKEIKLHPQSYNNLYAIRQSEIIFEISDNKKDSKDWESEIKKKLFSSDIDIGKIISEVKAEYSSRSQNAIPNRINELELKKENLKEDLYNLYNKNTSVNTKKDKIDSLTNKLNNSINILREKEEEYNKIQLLIDTKKSSENKTKKLEILSQINELRRREKFLNENKYLKEDYSEDINNATSKIEKLKNNISFLNGKIETLQKNDNSNLDYNSIIRRIEKSINKIDDFLNSTKKIPKWIIILIISLVATTLIIYYKSPLWLLIILPSLPVFFIKDNVNNEKLLDDIIDNLPEINLYSRDIVSLKEELNKELAKLEIKMNNDSSEELSQYIREINKNKNELEQEEKFLKELFIQLNIKNKENYYEVKNEYDNLYNSTEKLHNYLMLEAKKLSLNNINSLEAECSRILKELENIHSDEYNETEIKNLEKNLNNLNIEISSIKEEINKIKSDMAYINGELNSTENIHNKIVELESEYANVEEQINDIEKRKKALIILEDILNSISKKNNDTFKVLSNNSKVLYNKILSKDLNTDTILMNGFNSDKITVIDKSNNERNIESLSSATKDAVYIAMRLSILTQIHKEGRIILLDDPFITFDNNRIKDSIELICNYSKIYNIPIVLFTKDEFTKNVLKGYKDIIINELS